MTTPSSSATSLSRSPSPPLTYLPVPSTSSQSYSSTPSYIIEKDARKKAVQKFLVRAELSSVTRGLRARLSYASYKAANNISGTSLHDLDTHSPVSFARPNAIKRKAPVSTNHYNNPATQGSPATTRRSSAGSMLPPQTLTPRLAANGGVGASGTEPNSFSSRHPIQTLYTSILAPPPTKQARTILNADDPPIAAPIRPAPSPRRIPEGKHSKSVAEGTRAHAKARAAPSKGRKSPDKRKAPRTGEKRKRGRDMESDKDLDIKAAATLTSLLLHNRPSMAGSASSPRSSVDGSDAGSHHSFSQYAQSSARTLASSNTPSASTASSTLRTEGSFRSNTPPSGETPLQSTPRPPVAADNEAADLMLFLATSPSPARPNKDAKDLAAYRALGGAANGGTSLRAQGRVLFPSGGDPGGGSPRNGSQLTRGGDSSFNSSISSIGSDMTPPKRVPSRGPTIPNPMSGQLLPPPLFPPTSVPSSPSGLRREAIIPRPTSAQDFNFNDYINASPSPSRGPKINLGLRADVGRKLFVEEQMRLGAGFAPMPR